MLRIRFHGGARISPYAKAHHPFLFTDKQGPDSKTAQPDPPATIWQNAPRA